MPARSKVMALPREVRERLDRLLIERGFSGYAQLAEWLAEQGHPMSHAAVHRYGSALERRIEQVRLSTEMAQTLVAATPDDSNAMADAALRIAQDRMFSLLLAAEGGDLKQIAAAARAIAETARAGTAIRADRRRALSEAAEAADGAARRAGLSTDTAAAIRAAIEGLEQPA
ncbi:MAG: DUF3486 family protein [Defluviicoccus sp.]|nr:DUF3486 family protein [Defluviicoccus sp.]